MGPIAEDPIAEEALSGHWTMALAVMFSLVPVVAGESLLALDRVTGVLDPLWMGPITEDTLPGHGTTEMCDMLLPEAFPWLGADMEF